MFTLFAFSAPSNAVSGVTYHGRLMKPDSTPVIAANVQFRLQIRTPGSEDCLLYEEIQTADLSTTNGMFAISMADSTGSRQDAYSWTLFDVFSNRKAFNALTDCGSGTSYTPSPADNREFKVSFNDGSFVGWEDLPVQTINFIPMAAEASAVGGFPASSLLRVETAGALGAATPLTSTQYTELLALIGGTSAQYSGVNELNGSVLPAIGSGQSVRWTGSAWEAYTPPTNASLPTCTAGQVLFSNGSALSCVTDGGASAIDGDDITSGTIRGTTAWNTSGNITTTGAVTATGAITGGSFSGSTVSTRDLQVYESTNTNYVSIQAPAGLTPNYALTLPADDGGSGDILSTNGSGILSWITPYSGNVNLSNIRSTINPLSHVFPSSACTTSQTLRHDSMTDTYQCSDVEVASSGLPDEVILDGGNTTGAPVVVGTGDNQHFQIQTNGTTKMTILSNGDVGIGTAAPTGIFEISSAAASGSTAGKDVILSAQRGGPSGAVGGNILLKPGLGGGGWNSGSVMIEVGQSAVPALEMRRHGNDGYTSTGSGTGPIRTLTLENGWATTGNTALMSLEVMSGGGTPQNAYFGAVSTASGDTPNLVWGQQSAGNAYSERLRLDSSGNFGIGTANPSDTLHVHGTIRNSSMPSSGTNNNLCYGATGILGTCTSLSRYKTNVQDLNLGLDLIDRLHPVNFDWKQSRQEDVGFIAEEVERVDPRLASYYDGELRGVGYNQITAVVVKAVQELRELFQNETEEVESLKREIAQMKEWACKRDPDAPFCGARTLNR